jgi:hypothetical protein
MKLKVKVDSTIELAIKVAPFKIEAPNHPTLMTMIDGFKEVNNEYEIFYNCQKHNRKTLKDGSIVPLKWTANIYLFDPELTAKLYARQNPRHFDISYNELPPIKKIYKMRKLPDAPISKEVVTETQIQSEVELAVS